MSCGIPSSPESIVESSVESPIAKCEICLLRGHGNHFGVITCRACAAFFRRMTVGTGKRQKCHYNGDCKPKHGRWFCKKCRLDKCHRLGMTPENIQHNRDAFQSSHEFLEKRKKREHDELTIPLSFEKLVGIPQSIIHLRREKRCKKDFTFVDLSDLVSKMETILKTKPEFDSEFSGMSTLEKLAVGLSEVRKNQKQDLSIVKCIGKEETFNQWEFHMLKATRWIMYFDEFRVLPLNQKMQMMKCMWHVWGRMERLSMTAEMRVNRVCGKNQFVISHDSLVDYNETGSDISWNCKYSTDELMGLIDVPTYYSESLVNSVIELNPNDVELVFLLSNFCLRLTGKKLGGEIEEVAERLQDVLSDSLHNYYMDKEGHSRYAHRLTKLLSIGNEWLNLMYRRKEKISLAAFFDAFHVNFSHPELFQYST